MQQTLHIFGHVGTGNHITVSVYVNCTIRAKISFPWHGISIAIRRKRSWFHVRHKFSHANWSIRPHGSQVETLHHISEHLKKRLSSWLPSRSTKLLIRSVQRPPQREREQKTRQQGGSVGSSLCPSDLGKAFEHRVSCQDRLITVRNVSA